MHHFARCWVGDGGLHHSLLTVLCPFLSLRKVVAKILPFRVENKKFLDPIWNRHHIERIEIVLKETLDVKGELHLN